MATYNYEELNKTYNQCMEGNGIPDLICITIEHAYKVFPDLAEKVKLEYLKTHTHPGNFVITRNGLQMVDMD